MAYLIHSCKGCGSCEGTIKPGTTPHYYWRHMECPHCSLVWHACTFCLTPWDWEDSHLPSCHIDKVPHPPPTTPTLPEPITMNMHFTTPPQVVNNTHGGIPRELEKVSDTECIVVDDFVDPHHNNDKR